MSSPSIIQQ